MEKKSTSIYLSEKDIKKIEELKKLYDCNNTSELIRILVTEESQKVAKYKELIEG